MKEHEEYVVRMQYNMTRYDQVDVFNFNLEEPKEKYSVLLVTVKKPYDCDLLVARVLRAVKSWLQVRLN